MKCIFLHQLRERVAVYLLKTLAHPGLKQQQRSTGEMFKEIMLSLNLQSMRLNSGDITIPNDDEVRTKAALVWFNSWCVMKIKTFVGDLR